MGRGASNLNLSVSAVPRRYRAYRAAGGSRSRALFEGMRSTCSDCHVGIVPGGYYCGCLQGQERRVSEGRLDREGES